MRLLPLIAVMLALDFYVFQAIRFLLQNSSALVRSSVTVLYWLIPVAAIIYFFTARSDVRLPASSYEAYWKTFLVIAYLSKLVVALPLLIDDILRTGSYVVQQFRSGTPYRPDRSRFLTSLGLILGGLPLVSLTYGMLRNPYRYKVFREKVPIKNLPEELQGLKIVQISDIHSGSFTFKEPVRRAVELINREQPDLVFFTGDLVNSVATEIEDYIDVFDKIQATYGTYSVLGNHDYGDYHHWGSKAAKRANLERLMDNHRRLGWDLLMNENRRIPIGDSELAVIGVENYSAHPRFPAYGDLAKAYAGCEDCAVKLLLSHDPSHWHHQIVPEFSDIDITFSGHTHGMQFGIEIPGWLRWSPVQYVYKQWAGLYKSGQQYLYVNRGLGFLGYTGRVGILPEITLIELQRA